MSPASSHPVLFRVICCIADVGAVDDYCEVLRCQACGRLRYRQAGVGKGAACPLPCHAGRAAEISCYAGARVPGACAAVSAPADGEDAVHDCWQLLQR